MYGTSSFGDRHEVSPPPPISFFSFLKNFLFSFSYWKGPSLYTYLHVDQNRPTFDWIINIATQIAQGMGYLHTRKLLHKDLKSKNIFIEGSKAVISDFGLVATAQLCKKLQLVF